MQDTTQSFDKHVKQLATVHNITNATSSQTQIDWALFHFPYPYTYTEQLYATTQAYCYQLFSGFVYIPDLRLSSSFH